MIHIKRGYLLFVGLLLATLSIMAGPEAVFHKIVKDFTLNKDGSMSVRYQKVVTLNTHYAFNRLYGETFVIYNPEYQTVKINESYTKQNDGTLIQAPANAFNEVLPRFAADAPAYNHLRELVITHTGLDLGATIYLDYTVETKASALALSDISELLQEQSPVKEYQVKITVPSDVTLYYELTSSTLQPTITDSDKSKTYTWLLSDVPSLSTERSVPKSARIHLYASVDNATGHLQKMMSHLVLSPQSCADEVQRVVMWKVTDREKVEAIRRFVVNEIALVDVPWSLSRKVRSVEEILSSAYGTMPEKALLFASLLQAIGIQSEFVFLFEGKSMVPTMDDLSDILVCSVEGELSVRNMLSSDELLSRISGRLWSFSAESASPDDESDRTLLLEERTAIIISDSSIIVEKMKAGEHGEEETTVVPLHFLSGISTYRLDKSKRGISSWGMETLNSERKNPLEIPNKIKESYQYELKLDGEGILKNAPFRKQLIYPFGQVVLTLKYEGEKVIIRREIELSQKVILPNQYDAFRRLLQLWNNQAYQTLVIENGIP